MTVQYGNGYKTLTPKRPQTTPDRALASEGRYIRGSELRSEAP